MDGALIISKGGVIFFEGLGVILLLSRDLQRELVPNVAPAVSIYLLVIGVDLAVEIPPPVQEAFGVQLHHHVATRETTHWR